MMKKNKPLVNNTSDHSNPLVHNKGALKDVDPYAKQDTLKTSPTIYKTQPTTVSFANRMKTLL